MLPENASPHRAAPLQLELPLLPPRPLMRSAPPRATVSVVIRRALQCGVAFIVCALPVAIAQQEVVIAGSPVIINAVEASLLRTFNELQHDNLRQAMIEIDGALAKNPNFRLGQMIKGDILMAQSGAPVAFGEREVMSDATIAFRHEARVRLERYLDAPPASWRPASLMQVDERQSHVILVDVEKHRLFVFRNNNGVPEYVADFYVSAGKNGVDKVREGDQKTPLGVYFVTSTVPKEKLTDLYGAGAYPISYPNDWDKLNGRNGSGIWLHGTPSNTYSRPPLASDGCVVLTNDDFQRLSQFVDIGNTPVVITSKVDWREPGLWAADKGQFEASVEAWRKDWESLSVDRYLAHYSEHFVADGKDFSTWAERKRAVASQKSFVKVGITMLSAYSYRGTGSEPYMVVTFLQDYRSNNLSNKIRKRQYWAQENGAWKIVYETTAS